MKKRILALVTALLCFSMLLVGCDKEIPPCATHVDADNDALCDGCQRAIVNVVTELPYEEPVVETVVKPIPENAVITDYVLSEVEAATVISGTATLYEDAINEADVSENRYVYYHVVEGNDPLEPTEITTTHTVKDLVEQKTLYEKSVTRSIEATDYDLYTVTLYDLYFCVQADIYEGYYYPSYETTYTYYNYVGEEIYTGAVGMTDVEEGDGLYYLYFGSDVVVIDAETGAVLHTADANLLVKRPTFDYATDSYGAVYTGEKIYVYDLSKWLDCVYAYTLPSAYEDVEVFQLFDNYLLVQAYEAKLSSAINYDIEAYGDKYDIHYVVVDMASQTATEQEFGYVVKSVELSPEGMTEAAKNLVVATEITNKKENANAKHNFVVDEKLDILFSYDNVHIAQTDYVLTPVGDNLFQIVLEYVDGTEVEAIVDAEGNFKNYLPKEYGEMLGYLVVNGALYDYTMEKVFDFTAEGYAVVADYGTYVILSQTEEVEGILITTYYYYNGANAPKKLNGWDGSTYTTENGFVLKTEVSEEETVYTLYNAANEEVAEFDSDVLSITERGEDAGIYVVTLTNGDVYVLR